MEAKMNSNVTNRTNATSVILRYSEGSSRNWARSFAALKMTIVALLVCVARPASSAPVEAAPERDFSRMSKVQSLIDDAIAKPTKQREEDPLRYITHDMTGVVIDLDHLKTDRPVQ